MGFYGNITNTSRTQFVFDRTYSNRAQMDSYANTDGVYIGRYVLVEYDSALAADWCTDVYMDDGVFYTSPLKENNTKVLYGFGNIVKGKYLRVPAAYVDPVTKAEIIHNFDATAENKYKDLIYLILETDLAKEPNVKLMSESTSTYVENYQIDMNQYGEGRGYDSTVWQKVYTDNHERYVMIAELNTVVPTFGITADAPTMSPVVPHFDVDSSNVYYKVHWQPSWGLRVKTASPTATAVPIHDNGTTIAGASMIQLSEVLDKALPSDETTKWSRTTYDASTGTIYNYKYEASFTPEGNISSGAWQKDVEGADIPAAIFYNREGFNPKVVGEVEGYTDKISIEPTGKSGYLYNKHDGTGGVEAQIDTQELSIILPSIGNTISKVWDLVYGGKEANGSAKRNLNITWSDGSIVPNLSGLRMVTKKNAGYGYEPQQVNTIAGAINSVHDLMGMIVQEKEDLASIDPDKLNTDYIYFDKSTGKYYRKNKNFTLNPISTNAINWNNRYKVINQYNNEDWDLVNGHTNYYLDYVPNNPKDGNGNIFPNYILERYERYEDKQYYKVKAPDPNSNLAVKGEDLLKGVFQPKTYYTPMVKSIFVDTQMIETRSFVISMDETYKAESNYYNLTYEPLPDNARFYVQGAYYKISKATAVTKPNIKDFEQRLYFVKEGERYVRATMFDNTNQTTYYTLDFEAENGNLQNIQYFAVNSKVENGLNYVEQVTYVVDPSITSQAILDSLTSPRYITDGFGAYTRATTYEAGQTYYYKQSKLVLVPGEVVVSPENLDEVVLMLFENNKGYCYHIPRGQGGLNGFDEFVVLNNHLLSTYTKNLVQITANPVNDVYEPNTHYYQVDDVADPLYGSYIFDPEDIPVADRIYYKPLALQIGEEVENGKNITKVYEPFKYYYKNANGDYILDTRKTYTAGTTLYEKDGLYVYNDTTGLFPYGTEWNLNIHNVPANIQLAERIESWGIEELKGFARHYNTIHGLILRLNDILEQKNELIRDYGTAQGLMNKIKDILFLFGDLKPNEVMIVNNYGRVDSSSINGDDWINPQIQNGQIQISHNPMLDNNKQSSQWTIKSLANNITPSFGSEIELLTTTLSQDAAGHLVQNAISNGDNQSITLPSITFAEVVGKNGGNVIVSVNAKDLETATAKFESERQWVGSLQLDASFNLIDNDKTGIAPTDTINAAFGKVNTALNAAYDKIQETDEDIREDMALATSTIPLTHYSIYSGGVQPSNNADGIGVVSTDTINTAFAKVNARFTELELEKYGDALRILGIKGTKPEIYQNALTVDKRIENSIEDSKQNQINLQEVQYQTNGTFNFNSTETVQTDIYYSTRYAEGLINDTYYYIVLSPKPLADGRYGFHYSTDGVNWQYNYTAEALKAVLYYPPTQMFIFSTEAGFDARSKIYTYNFNGQTLINISNTITYPDDSGLWEDFTYSTSRVVYIRDQKQFISLGFTQLYTEVCVFTTTYDAEKRKFSTIVTKSNISINSPNTLAYNEVSHHLYTTIETDVESKKKAILAYSENYGTTWSAVSMPYNINYNVGDIFCIGPYLFTFADPYNSGADNSRIYYTKGKAANWYSSTLPRSITGIASCCISNAIGKDEGITPVVTCMFYENSKVKAIYSCDGFNWKELPNSATIVRGGYQQLISYTLWQKTAENEYTTNSYISNDGISWDSQNKTSLQIIPNKYLDNNDSLKALTGINYSLFETKTGSTWIDGKPIYRKVIRRGTFDPVDTDTLCQVPIGTDIRLGAVISLKGYGIRDGAALDLFPYAHSTDTSNVALGINGYNTDSPTIFLQFSASGRTYTDIYFIIEYTKSE